MTPEQLREMTGQENYQGTPRLVLNEILLNGDGDIEEVDGKIVHKGGYFRKRMWVGKKEDAKPEDVRLGDRVKVIFLKVRRKLVQRSNDGQIVRSTNEHNTVHDIVDVFESNQSVFTGSARAAREKLDGLRTVQVVYALLLDGTKEPELVRVTIKGASLGSDARPKELPDFYQYLGSFGNTPLCSFITELGCVLEQGKKKYFTMTFAQGDRVADDRMPVVIEQLQAVQEHTVKADARRSTNAKDEPAAGEYTDADFEPTIPA